MILVVRNGISPALKCGAVVDVKPIGWPLVRQPQDEAEFHRPNHNGEPHPKGRDDWQGIGAVR